MTAVSESLARKIIEYCFEHDVLTQAGMKGLRKQIERALEGADALHTLALARIEKLMDAADGENGDELSALADAVVAYERCLIPGESDKRN